MNRQQAMDAYRLDLNEAEGVLGHITDLIARQERFLGGALPRPADVSDDRYHALHLDRMKWEKTVKDIRELCPWIIEVYGWTMWQGLKGAYPGLNWDTRRSNVGTHTVYYTSKGEIVKSQLVGYASYNQMVYCAFAEDINTLFVYQEGNR